MKLATGVLSLLAATAIAAPVAPEALLPVVGDWSIQDAEVGKFIKVDGSRWKVGRPSERLDESATKAFAGEAQRFAAAVKSHASFPLALADVPSLSGGTVQVRFKPLDGREDQAAGIAFAVQSNGDYLILRANALEDNLILFRFKDGRRSVVKEVGHVPAKTGEWHTLRLAFGKGAIEGSVDDKVQLKHTLKEHLDGRIGLWSKADSVVQFRDLDVQAAR